ncbi:ABC-type branched-subunit amino acid transport system substrate-binding protein [Desulfobotulus alkaliphilus]|uniref:ABC-type branched-subunit amino acid transport system substrate-binding protein n=1 Tax=Desulfobotulus alkaliphilus TaxID=622671 RepID=A0A562R460_9BACT|nr:penicillin-binding protein activator [Desulfobotulus alkaliphilus]TWI63364.1 ABC-type branched-subunit amino acid transport system substrate-binding protein [Desulfobotulus alkaliphilus]
MKKHFTAKATLQGLSLLCLLCLFIFTGCARPPSLTDISRQTPEEKSFESAEKLYASGKREEAREAYLHFLTSHPDHRHAPEALYKLGSLYAAEGNGSNARYYFSRLIQGYPESNFFPEALLARCTSWYTENQSEKAFECIQHARQRTDQPEIHIRLAMLNADILTNTNRSQEALESLVLIFPTAPEALKPILLDKIFNQTRTMEPETILSTIPLAAEPEPFASLMLARAIRLAESGRYRSAEEILEDFLSRHPRHARKNMAEDLRSALMDKEEIDPLAIACLLPLTGRFEPFGNQALRGVEMAMMLYTQQENALPVRILIEDTRSDDDAASEAIRTLNDKKIMAAMGPLAASPESFQTAADLGLPLITLTQQEGVTDIGPGIFRHFMTPAMQVRALVSHAMNRRNLFRFAILHPDDSYGQSFRDLFWDEVENMGGRITGVESYPERSTDFSEPIRRLTGLHLPLPEDLRPPATEGEEKKEPEPVIQFDALFIPDSAQRSGLILPQLAYHDVEGVQVMGTNLWHSPRFIQMAGSHARGVLLPTGFHAGSTRPQVLEFVELFKETYGEPPGYIEAVVFDTLMFLFQTLEKTPYSRSEFIESVMASEAYDGVTGRIRFSEKRESMTPPFILEIRGGNFREVLP